MKQQITALQLLIKQPMHIKTFALLQVSPGY